MKYFLLTILTFLIVPILAHEFWLDPQHFILNKGDKINARFYVGEDFNGENWGGNNERIKSLQLITPSGTTDIADKITGNKGDSLQLNMADEGTAVITFNSRNSFIQLGAEKFNAYLKEDGLLDALAYRTENNELDSTGTESYQRSIKTIFQTGKSKTNNCLQQTTLPLDIVPKINPYTLKNGAPLKAVIYFEGHIFTGKLVNIWHRTGNKTVHTQLTTDSSGEIEFPVTLNGKWMISTVNMLHLENDKKAHWQSYWASCTWGYY